MLKFEVKCDWCGKKIEREVRRIGEAQRKNWRQFCSSKCLRLAKLTGKILACDNVSCRRKFYRPKGNINKYSYHFCSQSCAVATNNKIRERKKRNKLSQKIHQYQSNKIPKDIYAKRVIKTIKNFVKNHRRVPLKKELQNLYRPARIAFGTWNNAVKAAGFNPNQLKFTHKYLANDKHVCDSLAEKIIDDWLFCRKIKHQINYPYPENKKFTVDFKIGDCWVEFFGLSGQLKTYDKLKLQKIKLAKKYQLKLIKIYPLDLFPKNKLAKVLKILLN